MSRRSLGVEATAVGLMRSMSKRPLFLKLCAIFFKARLIWFGVKCMKVLYGIIAQSKVVSVLNCVMSASSRVTRCWMVSGSAANRF